MESNEMSQETVGGSGAAAMTGARRLLGAAQRVVVLTGAGISTDSGIPDFRGPQGLWTKNPKAERTSSLEHYLADPEVRAIAWQNRLHSPAWDAQPNDGHRAIVEIERRGVLHLLVTQNIDELHQRAGSSPERIVEIHGTMRRAVCWTCGVEGPMGTFLERVRDGEADPNCLMCGGIVKSATISFGQNLVEADLVRALEGAAAADLLIAVGSTLGVYPVARMVPIAERVGAPIIIVNGSPTEQDDRANVILRGSISELLPQLVS
jgi:NAD-dependent deacetylase